MSKASKLSVKNVKVYDVLESEDQDSVYEQYADEWEDEPSYENMKRQKLSW